MATRKKKNNIGAFGHPIYGKGFAKYGEMRPNDSSEIPKDLEEAANEFANQDCVTFISRKKGFIAGYKYHAAHTPLPEDTVLFQKGVAEGKRLMMEEAVEVCNVVEEGRYCQEIGPIFLDERAGFKPGDKVRIIVCKKEDEK